MNIRTKNYIFQTCILMILGLALLACAGDTDSNDAGMPDAGAVSKKDSVSAQVDATNTVLDASEEGQSDSTAAHDEGKAGSSEDAGESMDTVGGTDTQDSESAPTETESNGGGESCQPGEMCPVAPEGPMDKLTVKGTSVQPKTLAGGLAPSGPYFVEKVELYLEALTDSNPLMAMINIKSAGNTGGGALFEPDAWGIHAELGMAMELPLNMGDISLTQVITGGGCFTVSGNQILTDFLECSVNGEDMGLPKYFEYETSENTLTLLIRIPNAKVIEQIPENLVDIAKPMITGDLPLLIHFVAQ